METIFSIMSNLKNPLSFQTGLPKLDQPTGGKWLIHGTKHHKDCKFQSLELPHILGESLNMTERSPNQL